jgi:hypothetical protein
MKGEPMETNQRKVGRPKASPRTGPLVLGEDHGRTKVTLELSDRAATELAEYVQWVEECSGITASEAKFKTVDFAVREIFRRDRVWQAQRPKAAEAPQAPAIASMPTVAPAAPRAPSPSLPPPAPLNPRTSL